MTFDPTTLRLIRAAALAVAEECTSLIDEQPAADTPTPAPAAKNTRKKATPAPAEPEPEPEASAEPEATPEAPTPEAPVSTSTATAEDLALVAAEVVADPVKAKRYQDWRDSVPEFKGLKLRDIPDVGDNYDRVLEALNRANM